MIVNGKEYNLETLVKSMDFKANTFSDKSKLMLTNMEIGILERNVVDYQTCSSLKDLMIRIENILDDESLDADDADDLEYVLRQISERDYYESKPQGR